MLKRSKNVCYLVDKDTCKQFQKQNRQITTVCLDGNTWRTETKITHKRSAVSLLYYNYFITNFQDYFVASLSNPSMNVDYLVFLGGREFKKDWKLFCSSHLGHYFFSGCRFCNFSKIFNLILYNFQYMDIITFCIKQLSFNTSLL